METNGRIGKKNLCYVFDMQWILQCVCFKMIGEVEMVVVGGEVIWVVVVVVVMVVGVWMCLSLFSHTRKFLRERVIFYFFPFLPL